MLSHAFGLSQARLEAGGIENAHLPEQSIALHMMNVLWRGTFGHYLMELWNPLRGDEKDRFIKTPHYMDCATMPFPIYVQPDRCRCCVWAISLTASSVCRSRVRALWMREIQVWKAELRKCFRL